MTVSGSKTFYEIHETLKKKFETFRKPMYFYVSQTFVVFPNALLRDIFEHFGTKEGQDRLLNVHYSSIPAWG